MSMSRKSKNLNGVDKELTVSLLNGHEPSDQPAHDREDKDHQIANLIEILIEQPISEDKNPSLKTINAALVKGQKLNDPQKDFLAVHFKHDKSKVTQHMADHYKKY